VVDHSYAVTPNWPTGFTQLQNVLVAAQDGANLILAYNVPSVTPTGTYSVTFTDGANPGTIFAATYTGVGAIPIDASSGNYNISQQASPVSIIGTGVTTAFANDKVLFFGTSDHAGGASLTTGFTPPSGFTERLDVTTGPWTNITLADKTFATAGATGDITGTSTLSSGTAAYGAIVVALRGTGTGGAQSIVGAVKSSTFSAGAWAAASTVYTGDGVADADNEGYYSGLACSADGNILAVGCASAGWTGPGYGTTFNLSDTEQVQRWIGPGTGASSDESSANWPCGMALSADGTTVVAFYTSPTQTITFDGPVGVAVRSSGQVGIEGYGGTFGNVVSVDQTGLKMVGCSPSADQGLMFYTRPNKASNWTWNSRLVIPGTVWSVALSRSGTALAVGSYIGAPGSYIGVVYVYTGSVGGTWTLQDTLSATGGYTYLGRALAINNSGTVVVASEYTAVDVTGATGGEKRSVVRTFTRS
jgi:hypothetical protein